MKIKVIDAQSNWFVLRRQRLINDGNIGLININRDKGTLMRI